VIIDEAAFVDSLAELLKAALAFLMWGGQVVVCSTHDGTENVFNEHIQDILAGRSKYKHMHIDFDEALRDGLYQRICLVTGAEWSPEAEAAWRQEIIEFYGDGADEELFCIPTMGSGTWLAAPLIEARMTETAAPVLRLDLPADFLHRPSVERAALLSPLMEELETALEALDLELQYALGFDVGRVADLSVIPLLAIEQRLRRREVLSVELRGVPFAEQKMIVKTIVDHVRERLVGIAVDAVGIGANLAEDLGRDYGLRENEDMPGLVTAVKFTEDWYRLNMPPLKAAFEDDAISIAPDSDHLADLRLVKLIRGIPRVPPVRTAEEGKKGKKRHGDYAVGLALAHFASRMRWVEYGYRGVARRDALSGGGGRMRDLADEDADTPRRGWWDAPLGAGLKGDI